MERLTGQGLEVQPPGALVGRGRTAEVYRWGEDRVVKLYRPGFEARLAEREAVQARLVHAAGLPTPEVEDVVTVRGRPGIVFRRAEGPTMLEALTQAPSRAVELGRLLATLHVDVHRCRTTGLPGLKDYLLERLAETRVLPRSIKENLAARLAGLPAGDRICHGDFHPANVILSCDGPLVIDWFHATLGDPLADVANTLLVLGQATLSRELPSSTSARITAVRMRVSAAYLQEYRRHLPADDAALCAWRPAVAAATLSEHAPPAQRERFVRLLEAWLT